jgi:hypothetical protein
MKTNYYSLSRNEMKNILGGIIQQCQTSCSCTGSPGAWTYISHDPIPKNVLSSDIHTYCPTGSGKCTITPLS